MNVALLKTRLKINAGHLIAASVGWLARAPGHLRVLAFHDVGDDAGDIFAVTKGQLADCLSLLKDQGYVAVRARDLVAGWPSVLSRERVVLLTFDDGYAAQRDIAVELLVRHGMTATFFVISSLVSRNRLRCVFADKERAFLSGEDLRQMEIAGFEVGSHSHTHALCGAIPRAHFEQESALSKQILEQELGHPITSFAYPYGRQRAFSSVTRAVLQESGYSAAFTVEESRIERDCDLLKLPRTSINRFDTLATFRRKLQGQYDLLGKARRVNGRV